MPLSQATRSQDRDAAVVRRLRVEVVSGVDAGAVCEVDQECCVVGAAEDVTLTLSDPRVSRYHLELAHSDGVVTLTDLGSRNGTWVGPVHIDKARVGAGTRVSIGDTVLVVRDGQAHHAERDAVDRIEGFVAVDPKSLRAVRQVRKLAPSNASVLVRGETGTGKEVVARALHELSPRAKQPFVVVDCGSMAPTLVASELFGHERGAFTGADRQRRGAFERAHRGTLFLDEIGELAPSVQPALLGALERRRFRRVGGEHEIEVDVRVISATHRDLRQSVNDGSFRADLYYRLAVARIELPALRERPQDIPALVDHFVRELSGVGADEVLGPDVVASLVRHRFSGNVRELRNVVESALAMGAVRLETTRGSHAGMGASDGEAADAWQDQELPSYREARAAALTEFEARYLKQLVKRCASNATAGARVARMDRNYLASLLRKHGLR